MQIKKDVVSNLTIVKLSSKINNLPNKWEIVLGYAIMGIGVLLLAIPMILEVLLLNFSNNTSKNAHCEFCGGLLERNPDKSNINRVYLACQNCGKEDYYNVVVDSIEHYRYYRNI
jgi:hypothetical protein